MKGIDHAYHCTFIYIEKCVLSCVIIVLDYIPCSLRYIHMVARFIVLPDVGLFCCRHIFATLAQMANFILASLIFATCRNVAKYKHTITES